VKKRWPTYLPFHLLLNEASAPLAGQRRRERMARLRAAHTNPRIKKIPREAIKVPLPNVPQPDGISCGDAALLSILLYYGVGLQKIGPIKKRLKTTRRDGTYYKHIAAYADQLGLKADILEGMTTAQLERHLTQARPVICSIQAYGHPTDYGRDDKDNGHFVVAIGFDQNHLYFMDPSMPAWDRRRGWISKTEFETRWHDDEGIDGRKEIIRRLGIVIYPRPDHTAFLLRAHRIV
jgi:predicted double-glycine peptidase